MQDRLRTAPDLGKSAFAARGPADKLASMEAVLLPIAQSPKLMLYLAELQNLSSHEEQQRLQFYDTIADGDKTEFINGEIIVHSPDLARHTRARIRLGKLIDTHVSKFKRGWLGDEKCLTVFTRNDYMPDIVFFGPAKAAKIKPDTLKFPVPDFVAEVLSPSTVKRDRGVKMEDYAGHGVAEYWIVDPEDEALEIWLPDGSGGYRLESRQKDGTVSSKVIEGLSLPARAIFCDDANLAALAEMMRRD